MEESTIGLIVPEITIENFDKFSKIVDAGLHLANMVDNPDSASIEDCMDALSTAGFDPRKYLGLAE